MDLNKIVADMKGKFPHQQGRLRDAAKALDYFQGRFQKYWPADEEGELCPRRTSVLLQHIVNTVCTVNKEQPSRTVNGNPKATEFLQKVYSDNKMYAKMLAAEKLSCVSEVAAFQVTGSPDKEHPIKIHIWDASSIVVYVSPEDPTVPVAVVTIDGCEDSKRFQVWTDTQYAVFQSRVMEDKTTEWDTVPVKPNPYGSLPFAFAHWQTPSLDFWSGSPGNNLVVANDYVNRRLSKLGAANEFLSDPITLVRNARDFNPGKPKPGEWIPLHGTFDPDNASEKDITVEHLQPDYSFNQSGWDDLMSFIDLTLEQHGVPLSATRMVQSTGRSGNSIQMEQWPLASARKSRQSLWRDIEHQLAKVVFKVAGEHLKNPMYRSVAANLNLTISYPEVFIEVPGPERDRGNEWELKTGMKSKIQLYCERNSVTREEAIAHLQQVAEDNALLAQWGLMEQQEEAQEASEPQEQEEPLVDPEDDQFFNDEGDEE